MPAPGQYKPIEEIMAKIQKGSRDECWPWTGVRDKNGYGRFKRAGKILLAHRFVFEQTHGRPPLNQVLHTCDNPPCCNPAHLWEGTVLDNMRDKVAKGRQPRGDNHYSHLHPEERPRGSKHGNAKLNEHQVMEIRKKRKLGYTTRQLVEEYGVSKSTIERVIYRIWWKHV